MATRDLTVEVSVKGGKTSEHKLRQVGEAGNEAKRVLEGLAATGREAGAGVRRGATDAAEALDRLSDDAQDSAASLERAGQASARASQQMDRMTGQASGTNNLLFEMAAATEDAQYGLRGVSNQIPQIAEQFSQLRSRTGSTKDAFASLLGGLTGPGGLILGFTALTSLAPAVISFFEDTGDSAEEAKKKYEDALDAVLQFELKSRTFTLSSAEEAKEAQAVVEQMIERQKENLRLMADQLAAAGKTSEEIQSDEAYQEQVRRLKDYEGILEKIVDQREQLANQERIGDALDEAGIDADTAATEKNTEAKKENADAHDQARAAIKKARAELEKFEGKLGKMEEADTDRLVTLRRQTQQVKAQLRAYKRMIEQRASRDFDRLEGEDVHEAPSTEEIEANLQAAVPDKLPTEPLDRLQTKLDEIKEKYPELGEQASASMDQIASAASQTAGGFAQAFQMAAQSGIGAMDEFFAAYKAMAVAQAIADTYKAANAAYSAMAGIPVVGPGLGAAAAAAAVATGLARVAKISQMSAPSKESDGGGGSRKTRSAPGRAKGGPVKGGEWYIVGEEGPEMLVPEDDGQVLPSALTRDVQDAADQPPMPPILPEAIQSGGPRGGGPSGEAMESMREEVEALRKSVEAMEGAADTFTKRRPKARVDAREIRGGLDQVERDDNATFGKTSRGS
jgi:hypothetical protein